LHMFTHTRTHLHTLARVHTNTHIFTSILSHTSIRIHTHAHTHTFSALFTSALTSTASPVKSAELLGIDSPYQEFICVCMYVHIYGLQMCLYVCLGVSPRMQSNIISLYNYAKKNHSLCVFAFVFVLCALVFVFVFASVLVCMHTCV